MSGRWRDRITGGRDEFTDPGRELSPEQREHLTRVTDELLKRYSISRSPGPGDGADAAGGELVTADEIGAVLESVLAEAFDFGWFTRSDHPEAPELTMEPEEAGWEPTPAGERTARPVLEPVEWTDPGAEEEDVVLDWGLGLGGARAMDPQPDSELILEPVVEPTLEPVVEDVDRARLAAVEVAELEEIHRGAVQAEREAIMFAAATRQRLAEARQALAELQTGA